MRRPHPRTPAQRGLFLFVAVALVAAACSSEGDAADVTFRSDATTTTVAGAGGTDMRPPGFSAEGDGGGGGPADSDRLAASTGSDPARIAPVGYQAINTGRDIIFTADMMVAVSDVAAAGEAATRVIAGLGGFLFGQRTTGGLVAESVFTFKVAPSDFQVALDGLAALGEVRSQNVSASDVTDRIVDLESRILSAEASVERLRGLLGEVAGIPGIVQIETELLARETQLETLRGQLRTVGDQVAFATIVLTLTEAQIRPGIDLTVTAYSGHDGAGASCDGDRALAVDEASEVTVCFEVANTGDTGLVDLELADPVLDLGTDDLVVVFGDLSQVLEPGDGVMLAAEIVAERDLRTQTRVTANPVNREGETLVGRAAAATTTIFIDAVDPGGIAGFNDGLSASLGFTADVGRVLILAAGVILPFAWLLPLLAWVLIRRRRKEPGADASEEPAALGAG